MSNFNATADLSTQYIAEPRIVVLRPSPWTEARTERLKFLWSEGASCSEISAELGNSITRSAVIGKVHRLGLEHRHASPSVRGQRKPRASRAKNFDGVNFQRRRNAKAREVEQISALPPDQSECAIPFLEQKSGQCKYPLNDSASIYDLMVCGAPVCQRDGAFGEMVDTSWCLRHHGICFRRGPKLTPADRERRQRQGRSNIAKGVFR